MANTVVATENALRTAIQRKLRDIGSTGRFFRVRYDEDGMAQAIDPDSAVREVPSSVVVNEVTAEFTEDTFNGRRVAMRRTSWRFELHVDFDHEVTLAFFEQDHINPVPRVDKTSQHTYALLRLTSVEYDHPATDGSAGGTMAVLTWEADIGR